MEIGVTTFVETSPDVETGKVVSHAERIREVVEEIVLADKVGLDVFGVGEHHERITPARRRQCCLLLPLHGQAALN